VVDTTPPDVACPGPLTLVRNDPAGTPASDPEPIRRPSRPPRA